MSDPFPDLELYPDPQDYYRNPEQKTDKTLSY